MGGLSGAGAHLETVGRYRSGGVSAGRGWFTRGRGRSATVSVEVGCREGVEDVVVVGVVAVHAVGAGARVSVGAVGRHRAREGRRRRQSVQVVATGTDVNE